MDERDPPKNVCEALFTVPRPPGELIVTLLSSGADDQLPPW
jgi:hypothetical protein